MDADDLRRRAAQATRLGRLMTNEADKARLLQMAAELNAKADAAEAGRKSGG